MFGSKLDIFKKDWTDVIFKGRNKEYGAYELRQQNSRNTNLALIIGSAVFIFVISINTIVNAIEGFIPKAPPIVKLTDVKLLPPPPVDPAKKPPPPPPEPPKPKVDQVKFPPPVVKPSAQSTYNNVVTVMDELNITGIESRAIVDITPVEIGLLKRDGLYK